MTNLARIVLGMAMAASGAIGVEADGRDVVGGNWEEATLHQTAARTRLEHEGRVRWEHRRRSAVAHAWMPSTMYASTPVAPEHGELSYPVLPNGDTNRIVYRQRAGKRDSQTLFRTFDRRSPSPKSGFNVFEVGGAKAAPSLSRGSDSGVASHAAGAAVWSSIATKSGRATGTHHVYLFPSASEPLRQGFVRVINHSAEGGEVRIDPVDDNGRTFEALTLSIEAGATVHFNSGDLENGNAGRGLTGGTGSGQGDWRLAFTSDLDIEVLSYIRTQDGFLTAMHDVAPVAGEIPQIVADGEGVRRRIAIFNPGSNRNQVSRLRLVNPSDESADITIRGTDDRGMPGAGEVTLSLEPGTVREITAAELESGASGLIGSLGDGSGKWQLNVTSDVPVVAMNLLRSPTGHLTNLSTSPFHVIQPDIREPASTLLRVDFDETPLGDYTSSAFRSDWPHVEWVTGLGTGRAEIIGGSTAYSGRSLRLKYPAGTYGSRNQAIQAQMSLPESHEELYASYRVRFAEDFDFVKGGKLPGLTGGTANTGGNPPNGSDGWSGRMMWRRGGDAVQYLYHPDQPGIYGEDFRWEVRFEVGRWHTVEHRFVMNTPGVHNGVLQTWFDGRQTLYVDDLRFRDVDSFAIDHFYISTFFGGGDDTWAPTKDEYISFDDFIVSTARIQQ